MRETLRSQAGIDETVEAANDLARCKWAKVHLESIVCVIKIIYGDPKKPNIKFLLQNCDLALTAVNRVVIILSFVPPYTGGPE